MKSVLCKTCYNFRVREIKTTANLTCPKCNFIQEVEMPINACQYFYKCKNCGEMLKPKKGDCCVFCSYADIRCPPKQLEIKKGGEKL